MGQVTQYEQTGARTISQVVLIGTRLKAFVARLHVRILEGTVAGLAIPETLLGL